MAWYHLLTVRSWQIEIHLSADTRTSARLRVYGEATQTAKRSCEWGWEHLQSWHILREGKGKNCFPRPNLIDAYKIYRVFIWKDVLPFGFKINLLIANLLWTLSLPVWLSTACWVFAQFSYWEGPSCLQPYRKHAPLLGEKLNYSLLGPVWCGSILCWEGSVTWMLHQGYVGKYLAISAYGVHRPRAARN